jgi:16S rRNA (cytosine1402-N4)-methyltransferase
MRHVSVLLNESLDGLLTNSDGWYVDGTAGAGGHAFALLSRLGEKGRLLALDQDETAISLTASRLAPFGDRAVVMRANFSELAEVIQKLNIHSVCGVLLDLGVSSMQLDCSERGFSFMQNGPLDMRMDQRNSWTAAAAIRELTEEDLARVLRQYGEEPRARVIAREIARELRQEGPDALQTTDQLSRLVGRVKRRTGRTHPATQTFQALRILVNRELEALEQGLQAAFDLLVPGGRLAVITFHSLEDRIVKQFMVAHEGRMESLAKGGQRWAGELPRGRRINKKPIVPSAKEMEENPRGRSAKLRILERWQENG